MSEKIAEVHDEENNGCLFFIFIVLVLIFLQLNAIRSGLKDTFQPEKPVQQVEVEK